MKKSKLFSTVLVVIILIGVAFYIFYLAPSLKIASGYTAKYVCSATFVSGLEEEVINIDLDLFLVNKVKYTINREEKYVEASLFGIGKHRAYYYQTEDNCGCNLNIDKNNRKLSGKSPLNKNLILDTIAWPYGDKLSDTVFEGVDLEKIKQIVHQTLDTNSATRAITIVYKNNLIAEEYAPGITATTRLLGWSMTKTMCNALIGNLVKNGLLDINKPAPFPEWQNDERKNITVNNLIQMSSGLKWVEDYAVLSNVTKMLYLERDLGAYAASVPFLSNPDENWVYSSGTTNILSEIIRKSLPDEQHYHDFLYDSLFDVLGMRSALVEMDDAGTYIFSSYGWATARDWTRFGMLYLNKGMANGKEVFTPEWADYSETPASASGGRYGAQIWLNSAKIELPNAPADAFYEDGFGGQRVLVIPSKEMMVVMLSGQQKDFDFNPFVAKLLECIP